MAVMLYCWFSLVVQARRLASISQVSYPSEWWLEARQLALSSLLGVVNSFLN